MTSSVNNTWSVYVITTSSAADNEVTQQISLTMKQQRRATAAAAASRDQTMTTLTYDVITYVILPTMVVLGALANAFVFVLLWRQPRKTSVHVYVSVLTLTCALVLAAGTGYTWLVDVTQWLHVGNMAEWTCKLWQFTYNVLVYTPNWLLVALLADQTLLARRSRAARELCRPYAARLIVITIETLLASVAIHVMWTYELTRSLGCNVNPRRRDFFTTIWLYISASLYLYLPILLALALAVACLTATLAARKLKKKLNTSLLRTSSSASAAAAPAALSASYIRPAAKQPVMTLAVTLTFIGLLMPGVLLNIVGHVMTVRGRGMGNGEKWMLAYITCQLLACLGYSSVPVICFLSDRSLRRQVAICRSKILPSCSSPIMAGVPTDSTDPTPLSVLTAADDTTETAATHVSSVTVTADLANSVECHTHVTIYRCHSTRADPVINVARLKKLTTEVELAALCNDISNINETNV